MDEEFLYKTKAPKGIYIYPIIFFFIALAFMYYDVPILTTYFYLVIAGIILYIIYIIRNPLPSIVSVYTDKIILSQPFRLRKNIVYYYKDIHSEFVISVYSIDFIYFWKDILSVVLSYMEKRQKL
ncbi:MAG: hypothetical protein IPL53_13900 [Ignavibacteria bacterium]|nr:hypothetical protein [Ignavibacteria bacterium]